MLSVAGFYNAKRRYLISIYLPPEVTRDAFFLGRNVFLAMKYFEECTYLWLWIIDSLCFMTVHRIEKNLGLTQIN